MKYLIILFLTIVGTPLLSQTNSRVPSTTDKIYDKRDDAERRTGAFSLKYLSNPENRHLAFILKIDGDELEPVRVIQRQGPLPYRSSTGGPFKVELYDANGKSLKTFYIEDPAMMRSCDAEKPDDVFLPLPSGTEIEVILPDLPQLSRIEMVSNVRDTKYNFRNLEKLINRQ